MYLRGTVQYGVWQGRGLCRALGAAGVSGLSPPHLVCPPLYSAGVCVPYGNPRPVRLAWPETTGDVNLN